MDGWSSTCYKYRLKNEDLAEGMPGWGRTGMMGCESRAKQKDKSRGRQTHAHAHKHLRSGLFFLI